MLRTRRPKELPSTVGWNLVAGTAQVAGADADAELEERLGALIDDIEAGIHKAPNRTRYAMNSALIGIGGYFPALTKKAIAAGRRIGKVDVDHGETGCKTPDAVPYIEKMVARRANKKAGKKASKKAGKKAARKRA